MFPSNCKVGLILIILKVLTFPSIINSAELLNPLAPPVPPDIYSYSDKQMFLHMHGFAITIFSFNEGSILYYCMSVHYQLYLITLLLRILGLVGSSQKARFASSKWNNNLKFLLLLKNTSRLYMQISSLIKYLT